MMEGQKGADLQISEYSHGHTLDEVLQRILDEAETLVESKIDRAHSKAFLMCNFTYRFAGVEYF